MPDLALDPSQSNLVDKVRVYLKTQIGEERFFNERRLGLLTDESGFCAALGYMWGYARYLQEQPLTGKARDDIHFWNTAVELIASWDEKREFTPEEKATVERFLGYMEQLQNIERIEPEKDASRFATFFADTKNRQAQEVYSLAGIFKRDQLSELLTEMIKPGLMIKSGTETHAVQFYLDKAGNYHYYDSNLDAGDLAEFNKQHTGVIDRGEVVSKDITVITAALDKSLKYIRVNGDNVSLKFQIDRFVTPETASTPKPIYPSHQEVLEKFAAPVHTKVKGARGIHMAAHYSSESLEYSIKKDPNSVTAWDAAGQSPLHIASLYGNTESIKTLIQENVPVDLLNKNGGTPLLSAKNLATAALLLEKGADIHAKTSELSMLTKPAQRGNLELLKFLEDKGAGINEKNSDGKTICMLAAEAGHVEVVKYLASKGADLKATDVKRANVLHYAAQSNEVATLKFLLDQGIEVDSKSIFNETPLMEAIRAHQLESMAFLVKQGADVNFHYR